MFINQAIVKLFTAKSFFGVLFGFFLFVVAALEVSDVCAGEAATSGVTNAHAADQSNPNRDILHVNGGVSGKKAVQIHISRRSIAYNFLRGLFWGGALIVVAFSLIIVAFIVTIACNAMLDKVRQRWRWK